MVTTNVKNITNVSDLSILVHDEYQNSFCEVHYECLLQRLIITISSFALIFIEAVIILCVILMIFLKKHCVLWSYLYSKDENRNRIIWITGLIFKNIRNVDDPVGH